MTAIGKRIEELRIEKGWTKSKLARKAGVSNITIGNICENKHKPTNKTLKLIAEGLGVEIDDIYPKFVLDIDQCKDTGDIIKMLCLKKGISYRELAETAEIDATTIYNIIQGKRPGTIRILRDLAKALEVENAQMYPQYMLRITSDDTTGSIIHKFCLKKGITYGELAEEAKIDRSYIYQIIKGKYSQRYETLDAIANALGVKVEDLKPKK